MPRMDRGSCFGRILDWDHGGYCSVTASADDVEATRRYLDGTLVLETHLAAGSGEARVVDLFAIDDAGRPRSELLRIIDGERGHLELDLEIVPRFDYGELAPWIRSHAFRRFVERSAAGSADGLQVMYGLGGQRRLTEVTLDGLDGYRGARPVRVGNAASQQRQLDIYGHLLQLAWRWHERGHSPDDGYWRFLLDVVDAAAANWDNPDRGIWEIRGAPRHFVHSKAMCWAALDRGVRLAEASLREAPLERWRAERDKIRAAIERDGYDDDRGVFLQAFGGDQLDSALLLLPEIGFVAWDDERMVRTVDAIRDQLDVDGLLLRYRVESDSRATGGGHEGTFLACSFWLAECLARQGRATEAQEVFERATDCGNDLGLFAEEYDPDADEMLGNFPQALTHMSHIGAAVALAEASGRELEGR